MDFEPDEVTRPAFTYDELPKSDQLRLDALAIILPRTKSFEFLEFTINRLADYALALSQAPDRALRESVLRYEESFIDDMKSAHDACLNEIKDAGMLKAFRAQYDGLSFEGKKVFWAPAADYNSIRNYELPWFEPLDEHYE